MVFTALRKSRKTNILATSTTNQNPKSPEKKKREKLRLKGGDAGFGLLDEADDDPSEAFEPLDSNELTQHSFHSKSTTSTCSNSTLQQYTFLNFLDDNHATVIDPFAPKDWSTPAKDVWGTSQPKKSPLKKKKVSVSSYDLGDLGTSKPTSPLKKKKVGVSSYDLGDLGDLGTSQPTSPLKKKKVSVSSYDLGDLGSSKPTSPLKKKKVSVSSHNKGDLEASTSFFDENFGAIQCRQLGFDQASYFSQQTDGHYGEGQSQYSDEHSHSSQDQERSGEHLASPSVIPEKERRPTNHLLALVHHGDWRDVDKAPEMKSPDQKQRRAVVASILCDSDDSSDDDDGDDDGRSSSESDAESEVSHEEDEAKIEVFSDDDDDDDETVRSCCIVSEGDEPTVVQRKLSRMTSGQLRRWDGFREQVTALVQQAMPDNLHQVASLMQQFASREAELVQTLQTMCHRQQSPVGRRTNRPGVVHRSRGAIRNVGVQSPRRTSAIVGRKIYAIASIAAASTLDDHTVAVKPEYVVDNNTAWQTKHSGYTDDDPEEEDDSCGSSDDNTGAVFSDDNENDSGSESYEDEGDEESEEEESTTYYDDNDDSQDDRSSSSGGSSNSESSTNDQHSASSSHWSYDGDDTTVLPWR
jgi:hypothetical protein